MGIYWSSTDSRGLWVYCCLYSNGRLAMVKEATMRDKIIEIFETNTNGFGVLHWNEAADEILELYREGMNCEECDWREVFEQERQSDKCNCVVWEHIAGICQNCKRDNNSHTVRLEYEYQKQKAAGKFENHKVTHRPGGKTIWPDPEWCQCGQVKGHSDPDDQCLLQSLGDEEI